eukprot:CAMPEP_0173086528 /NCGR_PEP_ID=MMETSP1102-20130122/22906_1 /TAXON_ID=49646 /ORGANISM="Geminigera sp., Strain Caron Lab Isolate" /LENGTH=84 /DNA_ID=CAMNT_0013967285 /DNA_START=119 /DNA_END=372 /DNA_ORIENTATION=+
MAEGLARRDAVAGAALAAGIAVIVAPQAASARDKNGKETGAFASDSYSKYQKGYPKNNAPIVKFSESSDLTSSKQFAPCGRVLG